MSSRTGRITSLVRVIRRLGRSGRVALLIDGPNVLRREFDVRLDELKRAIQDLGKVGVAKVYLNERASDKLLEAIANSGFTPCVTTADVHIMMAIDAMDLILGDTTRMLAIFSRHARAAPILRHAREYGLETLAIGFEPGFSIAVQNAGDHVLRVDRPLAEQIDALKHRRKKASKEKKQKEKEDRRKDAKSDHAGKEKPTTRAEGKRSPAPRPSTLGARESPPASGS
jgi:uncharacterized protein (TIGR00288 family)